MNLGNTNSSKTIEGRSATERSLNTAFIGGSAAFAIAIAGVLIWIAVIVAINASHAISEFGIAFLFTSNWNPVRELYGVAPAIYGTLVSSLLALVIAVPIGLGTAIFLSEDYLPSQIQRILVFLVELLAAIPSVVYGLWGIFALIPFLKIFFPVKGPSLLPAVLILAVMILPTIAAISRDALINVPVSLRQAAYGVGATRWETIMRIIIPAASSGIIGGGMLALGRALGETMAVTMLIGNANKIYHSLFEPSNTIASLIANQFAEATELQKSSLMYAGLILFAITLLVNIAAQSLVTRLQKI